MRLLSRTAQIATSAERVFKYVDDIRNLARHMSESRSMPMMGLKLTLDIRTPYTTGIGATYRNSGSMMGLVIDFSEAVTKYVSGREKRLGARSVILSYCSSSAVRWGASLSLSRKTPHG